MSNIKSSKVFHLNLLSSISILNSEITPESDHFYFLRADDCFIIIIQERKFHTQLLFYIIFNSPIICQPSEPEISIINHGIFKSINPPISHTRGIFIRDPEINPGLKISRISHSRNRSMIKHIQIFKIQEILYTIIKQVSAINPHISSKKSSVAHHIRMNLNESSRQPLPISQAILKT